MLHSQHNVVVSVPKPEQRRMMWRPLTSGVPGVSTNILTDFLLDGVQCICLYPYACPLFVVPASFDRARQVHLRSGLFAFLLVDRRLGLLGLSLSKLLSHRSHHCREFGTACLAHEVHPLHVATRWAST